MLLIVDDVGEGNALFNKRLVLDESGDRAQAIHLAEAAIAILQNVEGQSIEGARKKLAGWREELSPDPDA